MSNQLVKKDYSEGYRKVFPKTFIDAIKDRKSGLSLTEILQGFNMYFLSYNGNKAETRNQVPPLLRKEGLWITYVLYDHTVVSEWYGNSKTDDNSWGSDENWRIASSALVGDISISADGYWVINGIKTASKAQGERGTTPLLRIYDNKLQVSYTDGKTYNYIDDNSVFTQYRTYNNKIQVSRDLGKTWEDASEELAYKFKIEENKLKMSKDLGHSWETISDYIAAQFRWAQEGTSNNIGKIQISRDEGKTWSNLTNSFSNNLHISRYIGANESLPTTGVAEGTIYMKGPYYDENDVNNDYPIYRMWVYAWKGDTLAWQDNGEFQSVVAGVVQERGDSELNIMSQAAVTRELTELESELDGDDGNDYIYVKGYGETDKKYTLILSGVNQIPAYQIIAETDIAYTGSSSSSFIALNFKSADGSIQPANSISGTVGQVIPKGTVILRGSVTPLPLTTEVYIGNRYSGTLKVVLNTREAVKGLKTRVAELESNSATNEGLSALRQDLINVDASIRNALNNEVQKLSDEIDGVESKFEDKDSSEVYIVPGAGTEGKSFTKILTNVTELTAFDIIAETDIAYTGASSSTFISINLAPTGATTNSPDPITESPKGTPGQVITKGSVILSRDYVTPLGQASDIYIGSRYSGTLKVVMKGKIVPGIETRIANNESNIASNTARIAKNETEIANNTARIEVLESNKETDIISMYRQPLQQARQVGYMSTHKSSILPIRPLAFMHISDTHSPKPNTRAIQILNYLGANGYVKFLMHTGDILKDPAANDATTWASIVSSANYPVLVSAGNHDVGNWKTSPNQYRTDMQFYNMFVAPQIGAWGLKSDGGGTPHPSGKNYYFTDFTDEKIRLIVTYEYEIPSIETQQDAGRGARWISQEQTDWFINSLLTTPAGYGVIVAKHAPDGLIGHDSNPFNSPFKDGENTQQTFQYRDGVAYTAFFADIVQAFIDRQSINYAIVQRAGTTYSGTINVIADFSTITSNVEFICHVSGHVHADNITHLETHPKQLELNINCDNTIIDNQRSETLLIEGTSFEDAINVYGIDRNRGLIHVLRIGANYSNNGDRKDMLTISYKS